MRAEHRDDDRVLESLVLMQAKVRLPLMRPPHVERSRLLDELSDASDTPVVLVSAPPGYGKTTLIRQWAERDEHPFAYVHLDESDNDPVVLLAYVALALETLGKVDDRVKDALRAPEPSLGRTVLPGLANDMADRDPFVLVLDDVHLLRNETCLDIVASLSEHMPAECRLVLAGRADPLIPLASLRVGRNLLEIRADRLLFDAPEAAALFEALGVGLDRDSIGQLVEQTEGWPAGLYLAALYLRDCDEPAAYIKRFRGDHRTVADYFMTEVLARQPDDIVEFLRRSSILERLSGSMCDAVLARRHSAELLAQMERSIPFLIPLDEHREWYRYHNLFAELLVGELYSREPECMPELHRRAAAWYESQAFLDGNALDALPARPGIERLTPRYFESALRHLLACGDFVHAGDLLARHWRPFAAAGRLASLKRMLDEFGSEQVTGHPPLALTAAWIAYLLGNGETVAALLGHAAPIEQPGHPEWREFRPSLALLRAGLGLGGVPGIRENVEAAWAMETETRSVWFGLSRISLGIVSLLEGDDERATAQLTEALTAEGQYGDDWMLGMACLALCESDAGDWESAREHAAAAYEHARANSLTDYFPSALGRAMYARVLAQDCAQAEARSVIADVTRLLGRSAPQWWHASLALLVIVMAQLDVGDTEGAERSLREARRLVRSREDAGALATRLASAQAAVGLRRLPEPLSPSELHVFEQLPSGDSLSEIARSIYLSRNTVKTHVRSIYRKLGVASREEAVDLGRSLGLLG